MTSDGWTWDDAASEVGFATVDIGAVGAVAELVAPDAVVDVFTVRERRFTLGARAIEGFAGRLAAKRAVRAALCRAARDINGEIPLGDIEVSPVPDGRCFDPARCQAGHPPLVRLLGRAARLGNDYAVDVSVSHSRTRAVAVAVVSQRSVSGGRS